MPKEKNISDTIKAKGVEISVVSSPGKDDYISLTDMAKFKNAKDAFIVVANWFRNRNTIEFLGLWETLNNPAFKPIEFEGFKNESGSNSFVLTPQQWVKSTNAIGITSKSGRYGGGTYAHKDIAFKFASWLSVEFELYVIKDYQRLKESEAHQTALDWSVKRILAKVNYKIHTDAVKDNLISEDLTATEQNYVYANEADLLNVAVFGKKAWEWKLENPDEKGKNIRDFASIEELLVIANLETTNALLIKQGLSQQERLSELRKLAITLFGQIQNTKGAKDLKRLNNQTAINLPDEKLDNPKKDN
ncbi:MAG: KilA-N domain-containing protein [Oscillospiraceae bacterium]|nr:KilA-N domain-containing protein [Oscillospiraceae bacterium]